MTQHKTLQDQSDWGLRFVFPGIGQRFHIRVFNADVDRGHRISDRQMALFLLLLEGRRTESGQPKGPCPPTLHSVASGPEGRTSVLYSEALRLGRSEARRARLREVLCRLRIRSFVDGIGSASLTAWLLIRTFLNSVGGVNNPNVATPGAPVMGVPAKAGR